MRASILFLSGIAVPLLSGITVAVAGSASPSPVPTAPAWPPTPPTAPQLAASPSPPGPCTQGPLAALSESPRRSPSGLGSSPAWTGEGNQIGSAFGHSLAAAGDVNGDGYCDIVIGAPDHDHPLPDQGRALVYHGSPSGPSETAAWTADGSLIADRFGWSVAGAGDVNGDGYADVIVGACGHELLRGQALVYHGSPAGLCRIPDWVADGEGGSSAFGSAVAGAGDVNGDGFSDVIVSAIAFDRPPLVDVGRVYLYLGSAQGLSTTPAWTATGNQENGYLGESVAAAGDVNGDGYGDVIVGYARRDHVSLRDELPDAGQARVYLGSARGLSPIPHWSADGDQRGGRFGTAVAAAGDVNGDGYGDIAVGAPLYDGEARDEGRAYVYLGSASGPSMTPSWIAAGDEAAELGRAVSTVGDVNGDGYGDLLIGARLSDDPLSHPLNPEMRFDAGRVILYLGSLSGLSAHPAWSESGATDDSGFGLSVAAAGDVNGDGMGDALIGAPRHTAGEEQEGAAFVFQGAAALLSVDVAWTAGGEEAEEGFGGSVGGAGDVNGDGFGDLIVGAPFHDHGELNTGRALLHLGSASGPSASPVWSWVGRGVGSELAASVASAGDVNADGHGDVIVGAPGGTGDEPEAGRAYVFLGSPTGLAEDPDWTAGGGQTGAEFAAAVASAGDLNGDGYGDVMVGAPGSRKDGVTVGRVHVYLGMASGLSPQTCWTLVGEQEGAGFGSSVASAGDVNGDGLSDIIIGAPGFDAGASGGPSGGRAVVYLGSPAGLARTPSWMAAGGQMGAAFGSSVASAGDLNGDGYGDVVVGAPGFDGLEADEGRVFVFLGSAAGLEPLAAWTAESNQAEARLGESVSTAGDVNLDGFSDLILGAPAYGAGGDGRVGAALIWLGSPTGLGPAGTPLNAAWIVAGAQTGSRFGSPVATAGDLDGDGLGDVVVGASLHDGLTADEGAAFVYLGDARGVRVLLPRQQRPGAGSPVALLGSSGSPSSFVLTARARSAAGRTRVRLEWQVAPLLVPLATRPIGRGSWFDSGAPGEDRDLSELIAGLEPATAYHWRVRVASGSPAFPHSPWLALAPSVPSLVQIRTAALDPGGERRVVTVPPARVRMESVEPNPFAPATTIRYFLSEPAFVHLSIRRPSGRPVIDLVRGPVAAGEQLVTWDGRDGSGRPATPGVYFARLEGLGEVSSKKIVLIR